MNGILPPLNEKTATPREVIRLLNQLRRQVPFGTQTIIPLGPVSLLAEATIEIIPANVQGWRTMFVDVIPNEIVGVQGVQPSVAVGTEDGAFEDIAAIQGLGTALVEGQPEALTIATPEITPTNIVYFYIEAAGSGPTTLTATVYIGGYFL